MHKILPSIFYLYIFTFWLPGNSIKGVPIKHLLFGALIIMIAIHFLQNFKQNFSETNIISYFKKLFDMKEKRFLKTPYVPMFISSFFIIVWYLYSLFSGNTSSPTQMLVNLISLIGTCFLTYYIIQHKLVDIESIKQWIFITAFVKVGFTLLIEIGIMNFGLTYEQFMNIYAQLDSQPVSMHMESLGMYRIMTPSDSFPFVALGFLIADKGYSKIIRGLTVVSLICFSLIIYSRIIFLQLALTLFIALILRKVNFRNRNDLISIGKLIASLSLMVALAFIIFPRTATNIYDSLTYRLFSEETVKSDNIRDIQADVIFDNIADSPIVGKGLGYYDIEFTRSDIAPYSYELEYFSFIMQFGILGFILIIAMLIYSFYLMINFNIVNLNIRYLIYFNFLFWVVKPFFNPNFLSSNSGSLIATLVVLSIYYFNREQESDLSYPKLTEEKLSE